MPRAVERLVDAHAVLEGPAADLDGQVDQAAREQAEPRDQHAHEPNLGDHTADPMLLVMPRRLIVKATAGADAPERCAQAFTVAATAVTAGAEVSLWLTGESSWFAVPGKAATFELPHSAPLPDLLEAILAGGQVTVCTQCAARRDLAETDLLPGVRVAGAAAFVEEVLADGVQALVY
jgi:predicted peroxiredoxin